MTTRMVLVCDGCGQEQHAGDTSRWGSLIVAGGDGKPRKSDICPGCIARLHGWQNPMVAGTGLTVRQWERLAAAGVSA